MKLKFKKINSGFAVITTVIFFLIISVAVISAVVIPTTNQVKSVLEAQKTRQSYLAADDVNQDAYYRLRLGKTLPSTLSLPFSNGVLSSASVTVSGSQEQILTTGTSGDTSRYAQTYLTPVGSVTAFAYGAQVGDGGIDLSGGASITGSVYSNGSIVASDSSVLSITGSATVANSAPATVNQTNSYTNGTTPLSLNMGTTTASQDLAQSFQVTSTAQLTSVRLYIKKTVTGAPADATIRIVPDLAGKPSNTGVVGTGTLSASAVTTSFTYVNIPITQVPSLTVGSTYWIVIDTPSVSATKYFTLAGTTGGTYANGSARYGSWSSSSGSNTWVSIIPSNYDLYFDVYLGGVPNTISGNSQYNRIKIGTSGTGSAWANQVNNVSVSGTIYCQSGTNLYDLSNATKTCDTSRTDPTPLSYPITDQNITDWKAVATAGGVINGNYSVTSSTSLGPKKIAGNLSVSSGATMSITGTIWVTGTITLSGGSTVKLASAGGTSDGMIISDGRISVSGGSAFQGSGTAGSYMVTMTTSQCPYSGTCGGNAIDIAGGSGSVVTFAPYGVIGLSGGAVVNSAIAKRFVITGGSSVNYDTGLTSIDFITTGISGSGGNGSSGNWQINSWGEVTQ